MFSRNFWGISKLRETNFTKFWEWIYDIRCIQIKVSAWVCILGVAREREPRCFLLLLSKLSTQSLETLGIYIYLSIVWCKKKLYNSACIFYNQTDEKSFAKKTSHRNMPCNFATESIISTAYLPFLLTVYHFTSAISWWRCFWLAGSPVSLACLKACQVLSELRLSQETQNCWSSRTFEALTIYLPTSITT